MSKYCAQCGKENEDEAIFCLECGERFDQVPVNQDIQIQTVNNDANEKAQLINAVMNKKSKGLACILSFFIPGLGHAYIKKYGRFVLILVIAIILALNISYASYRVSYLGNMPLYRLYRLGYSMADYRAANSYLGLSYIVYLVFWIIQIILTYVDAKKYNESLLSNGMMR